MSKEKISKAKKTIKPIYDEHEMNQVDDTSAHADTEIDAKSSIQDFSETNPRLHMLYTKWAIPHLIEIDKAIQKLDDFSNLNLLDVVAALSSERKKLVKENAAYAEADAILKNIQKHGGYPER